MGMFDHILCDYPLPDFPEDAQFDEEGIGWQTKSLDCTLSTYLVTGDGRLLRLKHPCQSPHRVLDIYYHGELDFYTTYNCDQEWLHYKALFEDGQLVSISRQYFIWSRL